MKQRVDGKRIMIPKMVLENKARAYHKGDFKASLQLKTSKSDLK